MIRFGSVCSGIEAASVAWGPLGWSAQWFAEIDKFPSAVLAHHYPGVVNVGDFTKDHAIYREKPIDLLVGGTPCQSFSVAGKRGGLDDPRGVLAFEFLRLCGKISPRWFVFENVPGLLSSGGGEDFTAWLGAATELGYGVAWRVLDAQFFGVPQRRRRVFVVGCLGDWRSAAEVLFEPESLQGDIASGRKKGKEATGTLGGGSGNCGWANDTNRMTFVPVLEAGKRCGAKADKRDGLGIGNPGDPMFTLQRGAQHAVLAFDTTQITSRANRSNPQAGDPCHPLAAGAHAPTVVGPLQTHHTPNGHGCAGVNDQQVMSGHVVPVAFTCKDHGADAGPTSPTLRAMGHSGSHANAGGQVAVCGWNGDISTKHGLDVMPTMQAEQGGEGYGIAGRQLGVRRLTPRECERLQGFPDDYTLIPHGSRGKPVADGPRYKALGNSMAVPVVRWIGERIEAIDRG